MPKDELIAALEKADGPSFALEVELHRWRFPDADELSIPNNYTASIDAALTLVPSGKGHDPWWMLKAAWRGKAKAEVWVDGRGKPFRGEAATPALAICIAALRATERGEAGR